MRRKLCLDCGGLRCELALDFDYQLEVDGDGLVVEHGWAPAELLDCGDDARIHSLGEVLKDLHTGGRTGLIEFYIENETRRVGKCVGDFLGWNFDLGRVDELRVGNACGDGTNGGGGS